MALRASSRLAAAFRSEAATREGATATAAVDGWHRSARNRVARNVNGRREQVGAKRPRLCHRSDTELIVEHSAAAFILRQRQGPVTASHVQTDHLAMDVLPKRIEREDLLTAPERVVYRAGL